MTLNKIKRDLKTLRKLTHSIESSLQVKERHEKRLVYLKESRGMDESTRIAEIEKLHSLLQSLKVDELIKESTALETLYMDAINKLEPLDRAIILEGYINGKAYWKIGRDIGYTERGVQNRINAIIEKLSKMI